MFVLLLLHFNNNIQLLLLSRAVTKISNYWVNTTSRWGIRQLGISFGSIFLLFTYESNLGPCSQ